MIKLKSNKGVTLAVLIITILVMVIILAITIDVSIDTVDSTIDSQDASEMLIVQHAIQERYVEYSESKDATILVGEHFGSGTYKISSKQKLSDILSTSLSDVLSTSKEYYIAVKGTPPNEEKILYYMDGSVPKEISTYKNAIKNENLDTCTVSETTNVFGSEYTCKKITDKDEIIIDSLFALGITGQGIDASEFEVNYETGYVKNLSANKQINSYSTNTTSDIIDID